MEEMMMPKSESQIFQSLIGIQQLAETRRFKAWLLDQFGVLHDGKKAYPGAISALEKLAKTGAKMVIISNSSRRASMTDEKMRSLGFDHSLFLGTITSGELTHQYLERRDDSWFAALGRSCIHLTWSDPGAISLDILEQCALRKIPMVVANPDYGTVEAQASQAMPGTLAAKYEQLGGEVKWMGKPWKVIYESAMDMAGVGASDCVAVGDSLNHDIKGANAAGMQSIFIPGGIHASELGLDHVGEVGEMTKIQDLASKIDAYPTYIAPAFTWTNMGNSRSMERKPEAGEETMVREYIITTTRAADEPKVAVSGDKKAGAT